MQEMQAASADMPQERRKNTLEQMNGFPPQKGGNANRCVCQNLRHAFRNQFMGCVQVSTMSCDMQLHEVPSKFVVHSTYDRI